MPLPANGKSILMTPDPYHTPGYGGFCPQFKYRIGDTFGKTTSSLLQDKSVASSGKLVLADIRSRRDLSSTEESLKTKLLKARKHSWGDQKLMEKMVPGYTGFIPKSQHFFGNRYAINCHSAISDFEYDQSLHKNKLKELNLTAALQAGKRPEMKEKEKLPLIRSRYITPLQPIAKQPESYVTSKSLPQHISPYYMANNNHMKNFMSGYTGFVPRSQSQLGMGYPIITHLALNEFTDEIKRHNGVMNQDVSLQPPKLLSRVGTSIYPVESGLVPHYTGHIPGQKFRYGQTFGHSTENAMKNELPVNVSI